MCCELKKNGFALSPLIQINNNSYGIPRSRGHNFLFKNVEIFEIRQNFAEIGRFELEISSETAHLLDSLYKRKGKSSKSTDGRSPLVLNGRISASRRSLGSYRCLRTPNLVIFNENSSLGSPERFKVSDHESDHFFPMIREYGSHSLSIL